MDKSDIKVTYVLWGCQSCFRGMSKELYKANREQWWLAGRIYREGGTMDRRSLVLATKFSLCQIEHEFGLEVLWWLDEFNRFGAGRRLG